MMVEADGSWHIASSIDFFGRTRHYNACKCRIGAVEEQSHAMDIVLDMRFHADRKIIDVL